MPAHVRHFAIHADDVDRAMIFYTAVFGWTFEAWGPPGFHQIRGAGLEGALHGRHDPLAGTGMRGFEITVAVEDLAATRAAVEAAGGTITLAPFRIETVGELIGIEDTEGNRLTAMRYDDP